MRFLDFLWSFKAPKLFRILFELFQFCFDHGVIPAQWYKSIIKPIPKSSRNDPKSPHSYRRISLISNVYKLYSALLNNRLVGHQERSGLLVDEQNGFWKQRACIDHIYSVTSIIRARQVNICMFYRFPEGIWLGQQRTSGVQAYKIRNKW